MKKPGKSHPDNENIVGYPVTGMSVEECIERIFSWITTNQKAKYFVCANPHSIVKAESDPDFKTAIQNADLIVPDGTGIVVASRILGGGIEKRITGSDIFRHLNEALNRKKNYRVFFLGSTEKDLSEIKSKMTREFPDILVAGSYAPPFKEAFDEEDTRRMVDAVNQAGPDVLWVGMTAPKQEKWIYQNRARLDTKFIGAVGAVFDFYIGKVKRARPLFLDTGLEWLPRLLQEPRRLWQRTLVSTPKFLFMVIKARFRGFSAITSGKSISS